MNNQHLMFLTLFKKPENTEENHFSYKWYKRISLCQYRVDKGKGINHLSLMGLYNFLISDKRPFLIVIYHSNKIQGVFSK